MTRGRSGPSSRLLPFSSIVRLATKGLQARELQLHLDAIEAGERAKPRPSEGVLRRIATMKATLQRRVSESASKAMRAPSKLG